jgi:orotate phosphoribosyltransferase
VAILSYAERQEHWQWCRAFIDREVIYRADDTHPMIPAKVSGQTYQWQFYLRRAFYNPHFFRALGLLFWDHFLPVYQQQAFQVCACHPSGIPVGMAIMLAAVELKLPLNLFLARREPKSFGHDNWFDGTVLAQHPVLMVDDAAASTNYMRAASARVQSKLGLTLHRNCFAVVNKVGRGFSKDAQHTENYLDNELVALFTVNNFSPTAEGYREAYGRAPQWSGTVK